MSGKGLISRMSDECLMKQETVFPFYVVYQAVMRKFTLARKTIPHSYSCPISSALPYSAISPLLSNLNALAYSGKKWYLCIEMSGKGSISRMSDECRKDVRWKKEDGRCYYPHPITPLIPYH